MQALLAAAAIAAGPAAPVELPGTGARAANAPSQWIVAATAPVPRLASAYSAQPLGRAAYRLSRARARAFAAALGRRLFYAEPDRALRRTSQFEGSDDTWARGAVVAGSLVPPAPGAAPIAVIDDFVDDSLPDLAGHVTFLNGSTDSPIEGPHGTMVASAAAAAADGAGVVGVLPGATIMSGGVPTQFSCADTAPLIYRAIRAKARVINMSYGSHARCFTEYVALQYALSQGLLAVAATGNEYTEGNLVSYPAGLPHVLSVAAVNKAGRPSYFSTANAAVDVAAPGSEVPLAIPLEFDEFDGARDGKTAADGTSFAAPIAAGAAAWLLSARPGLSGAQAGDLLRRTATELGGDGYDVNTGFGLVDLEAALAAPDPPIDPAEPNDGLEWVDGRAFDRPDPFVWEGGAPDGIDASLDEIEDPLDVYRFRVPAQRRVRVTVDPSSGDPGILVFRKGTKRFSQRQRLLAGSSKAGERTEAVTLRNAGSASWAFAVVLNDTSARALDVRYRLAFRRLASRP